MISAAAKPISPAKTRTMSSTPIAASSQRDSESRRVADRSGDSPPPLFVASIDTFQKWLRSGRRRLAFAQITPMVNRRLGKI